MFCGRTTSSLALNPPGRGCSPLLMSAGRAGHCIFSGGAGLLTNCVLAFGIGGCATVVCVGARWGCAAEGADGLVRCTADPLSALGIGTGGVWTTVGCAGRLVSGAALIR